ncbi:DUF3085 domain-containing protein [Epibacterium sp. DP7N7-1]|nr:DUF3085 domain-containing protein [Epibacterium sp. DP7N7-1]
MHLTFNPDHVAALLKTSIQARNRIPCLSQMVVRENWRDDLSEERKAALQAEIDQYGYALSIQRDEVCPNKIGPGLWIAGDRGVYLTSNAPLEDLRSAGVRIVAYAAEADPERVARGDWVHVKHASFGPHDGIEFLTAASVTAGLVSGKPYRIFMTPEQLILPVERENMKTIMDRRTPDEVMPSPA